MNVYVENSYTVLMTAHVFIDMVDLQMLDVLQLSANLNHSRAILTIR